MIKGLTLLIQARRKSQSFLAISAQISGIHPLSPADINEFPKNSFALSSLSFAVTELAFHWEKTKMKQNKTANQSNTPPPKQKRKTKNRDYNSRQTWKITAQRERGAKKDPLPSGQTLEEKFSFGGILLSPETSNPAHQCLGSLNTLLVQCCMGIAQSHLLLFKR